ncbi:hypothetical protein MTR67_025760 [Solanum verrucosum]|uniref:Gag-pol polyprotein n=1 Tax=Solanum verrucosum TaxID=315347 RepID=A0AAF0R0T5_SOLVR|nr:hypothetical protein MTR67_025760 [Solanum verrucosum]
MSIQITLRSIPDLQFSKISGESSFSEDNSHEFLFNIFSPLVSVLLDIAGACPNISSQLLAQSVTNQNNQQVPVPTNRNGGSMVARVRDFVRMNPPEFLGFQVGEDPQNFIDNVKKIFGVIQVTDNGRVKLASYQLRDVAHIWFTQWKDNRGYFVFCKSLYSSNLRCQSRTSIRTFLSLYSSR